MAEPKDGDVPEVPKWQDEWDFPEPPENPSKEELETYVTDIVARQRLKEDSGHVEKLIDLLRKQAQKRQEEGNTEKAQELREKADQLNEIAAINSAGADDLGARINPDED